MTNFFTSARCRSTAGLFSSSREIRTLTSYGYDILSVARLPIPPWSHSSLDWIRTSTVLLLKQATPTKIGLRGHKWECTESNRLCPKATWFTATVSSHTQALPNQIVKDQLQQLERKRRELNPQCLLRGHTALAVLLR